METSRKRNPVLNEETVIMIGRNCDNDWSKLVQTTEIYVTTEKGDIEDIQNTGLPLLGSRVGGILTNKHLHGEYRCPLTS